MANIFAPKATKEENRSEANRWLDKAVGFEAEGKSEKFVDLALRKAIDFENAAYAL